jgi:hypothetical protein
LVLAVVAAVGVLLWTYIASFPGAVALVLSIALLAAFATSIAAVSVSLRTYALWPQILVSGANFVEVSLYKEFDEFYFCQ